MSSSTGRAPRPRRVPFPLFETDESNAPAVAVPANHFLAQRAVTPPAHPDAHQSEGEGDWLAGARPDTSSLAAADYDVSVVSGFLPPDEPVQRLGGEWAAYELLLERAQGEVRGLSSGGVGRIGHQWRQAVEEVSSPGTGSAYQPYSGYLPDLTDLCCISFLSLPSLD